MMVVEQRISIAGEPDIVAARQHARAMARDLGFSLVDQSRIATAVSELTRNVVRYATNSQGEVFIREIEGSSDRPVGIEIIVQDQGPGIDDIDLVLRDGYTSGGGLGLGLPGARRLMDQMQVESALGKGTTVTVRKWRYS